MRAVVARPASAPSTTTRRARADKMTRAPMPTTTRASRVATRAIAGRRRAGDDARRATRATRDAERGDGVAARAKSSEDEGRDASEDDASGDSELTQGMIDAMQARRARKMAKQESKGPAGLEDVNPVNLGRKSRAAFENVFKQLTSLTSFQKSTAPTNAREFDQVYDADLLSGSSVGEFETPNAKFTTVLVTGATGRIGRVLIRKLLLRGYTVKALVRRQEDVEKLPGLVQVVVGDVGDKEVIKNAMTGVNKVIYCANAKTSVTSDLYNVADQGVKNVVSCMQDYYHMLASRRAGRSAKSKVMLTNFKHPTAYEAWDVEEIEADAGAGADGRWAAAAEMQRVNFDPLYPEDEDKPFEFATFNGFITSRTGKAEVSSNVEGLQADVDFSAKEGLLFRLKGDGKRYSVMLTQDDGSKFRFSFNTTGGWQVIRMPFHKFVSEGKTSWGDDGDAILDLKRIEKIGVRFDARKNQRDTTMSDVMSGSNNMFNLTLEYVKAIPKGEEPDIILVSCFGAGLEEGEEKERILKIKRDGERVLRNSGVGYTIVRPGELVEEAGGGKALVFDQTERINTPISCADVSDVCVKAMHDEEARNKSFDVGYEYESEQAEYELITQVKGKSDNYLTPALKVLEKNS